MPSFAYMNVHTQRPKPNKTENSTSGILTVARAITAESWMGHLSMGSFGMGITILGGSMEISDRANECGTPAKYLFQASWIEWRSLFLLFYPLPTSLWQAVSATNILALLPSSFCSKGNCAFFLLWTVIPVKRCLASATQCSEVPPVFAWHSDLHPSYVNVHACWLDLEWDGLGISNTSI